MWWACLFPVVWFMLMLLELTYPPFLDGDFFLPNLVMNYRGGLDFFFFLSCRQHSVGPSLITPRLVVPWSTLFVPFSAKPHVSWYTPWLLGV